MCANSREGKNNTNHRTSAGWSDLKTSAWEGSLKRKGNASLMNIYLERTESRGDW